MWSSDLQPFFNTIEGFLKILMMVCVIYCERRRTKITNNCWPFRGPLLGLYNRYTLCSEQCDNLDKNSSSYSTFPKPLYAIFGHSGQ